MVSEKYKLYVLAFVIYSATAVVTATLQALAIRYEEIAVLAPIITTLSGNFLGGFALVLGILRDDRAEKQRERADKAEGENQKLKRQNEEYRRQYELAQQQAEQAQQQAEQERDRAAQERDRAARAEAELQRVRAEREREMEERIRRLEAFAGLTPPEADDTGNDTQ